MFPQSRIQRTLNDAASQRRIAEIVAQEQFSSRSAVRCFNLASHALSRVLRRLPAEFQQAYGYRPWLVESFVEPSLDGACLKAARIVIICVPSRSSRYICLPWTRHRTLCIPLESQLVTVVCLASECSSCRPRVRAR